MRFDSRAGRLVLIAAAAAVGCGGKSQPSDAAVEMPGANCGGTIDVSGTSPEGPFRATSVYAQVSIMNSACLRGLQIIVGDAATGSGFVFELHVDEVDGGTPVPLGMTSAIVVFAGIPNTGTARFQATTDATIDVTAADPPPFATCGQAGNPIDLGAGSGNTSMAITMTLDGFAMHGTLSTPYCACRACPDTI